MPRLLDTDAMAVELKTILDEGRSERHQFVVRVDTVIAAEIIRHCQHAQKQPGPLLEEVLNDYYSTWDQGVHLKFTPTVLKAVDRLANITGRSREEVVRDIVGDNIVAELTSAAERQEKLRLLGEK